MKQSLSLSIQFILGLTALCASSPANAGLYLEMTGFPGYVKKNDSENRYAYGSRTASSLTDSSGISYDLRTIVGWSWNRKLLIGLNYNYANNPLKKDADATYPSLDQYEKSAEYGASIGYFFGNFRIIGSYLMGGTMEYQTKEVAQDGSIVTDLLYKNTGGKGIQVIAGYDFPIGKRLRIGPSLTYRSMTYEKQSLTDAVNTGNSYAESAFTVKATVTRITPMISISALW